MKRFFKLFIAVIILLLVPTVVFAQYQTDSNTKRTKVGSPAELSSACWPTTGLVTQGPRGSSSHAGVISRGGGPSIDIASRNAPPVYATVEGKAVVFDCTGKGVCDGGYGNLVKIIPDSSPNAVIYHAHLLYPMVEDGSHVSPGQQIGIMGETGFAFGAHLHYEFRGVELAPPLIPQVISPENCDGNCTPTSVSPDSCSG